MFLDLHWMHEDDLVNLNYPPSEKEYSELFASSRVIDGVRKFPFVMVDGKLFLVRTGADRVESNQ